MANTHARTAVQLLLSRYIRQDLKRRICKKYRFAVG